jgi:hypothetical protein
MELNDQVSLNTIEERLAHVQKLIQATSQNLDKISSILRKIESDREKELYKSLPGVEGVFDGTFMVADDGTKHEVPANYAAKSRIVFGDRLKMVEEDGKQLFKQVEKVERKKVNGVLTKKEGKWYLLADSGSYKVSDIAAEFNRAELNDEAVGIIPADNASAPYAALDMVNKKDAPVLKPTKQEKPVKHDKPHTPRSDKPKQKSSDAPSTRSASAPAVAPKPETAPVSSTKVDSAPTAEVAQDIKKEFVADITKDISGTKKIILDDDDDLR